MSSTYQITAFYYFWWLSGRRNLFKICSLSIVLFIFLNGNLEKIPTWCQYVGFLSTKPDPISPSPRNLHQLLHHGAESALSVILYAAFVILLCGPLLFFAVHCRSIWSSSWSHPNPSGYSSILRTRFYLEFPTAFSFRSLYNLVKCPH